jgi:ATP-dependent helicase HrpB
LATSVAQTSLTIPGVRSVIDSGLTRRASYDSETGATRLVTERSSRATAIQRAGRAGRESAGTVVRLWSKVDFEQSAETDTAEIFDTDLAETVLTLAQWGIADPSELQWIDPPPPALWQAAVHLVRDLGLITTSGRLTELGEAVGDLPAHPRVQAMLAFVKNHGDNASRKRAVDLATELGGSASLQSVFMAYMGNTNSPGEDRTMALSPSRSLSLGLLGAHMYPDRVAARIGVDPGRYQFANGAIATLRPDDPNRGTPFLVALELDSDRRLGKIFRAEALTANEVQSVLTAEEVVRTVSFNDRGNVEVSEQQRHGALIVNRQKLEPNNDDVATAVIEHADWDALSQSAPVEVLRTRMAIAKKAEPDRDWPDWSAEAITSKPVLDRNIRPSLIGLPPKQPLNHFWLDQVLLDSLTYELRQLLDSLAPRNVTLANSRTLPVDYLSDGGPTIRSRLQDFLGTHDGPTIARGTVPLRIELLSPAQRPAATTTDLRGFWQTGYRAVRSDLRHRYPKHAWPEDPLAVAPSDRAASRKSDPSFETRRRNG